MEFVVAFLVSFALILFVVRAAWSDDQHDRETEAERLDRENYEQNRKIMETFG